LISMIQVHDRISDMLTKEKHEELTAEKQSRLIPVSYRRSG